MKLIQYEDKPIVNLKNVIEIIKIDNKHSSKSIIFKSIKHNVEWVFNTKEEQEIVYNQIIKNYVITMNKIFNKNEKEKE